MKDMKMVMVGLDGAGKTTILYKLKQEEIVTTALPTADQPSSMPTRWTAFNLETIEHKDVSFEIWDLWGLDKVRCLWKGYFTGKYTDGLIDVVDSTDRDRVGEARHELHNILNKDEARDCNNVLVFAHKQDLPDAMDAEEVGAKLGLDSLGPRRWCVKGTSVISGEIQFMNSLLSPCFSI